MYILSHKKAILNQDPLTIKSLSKRCLKFHICCQLHLATVQKTAQECGIGMRLWPCSSVLVYYIQGGREKRRVHCQVSSYLSSEIEDLKTTGPCGSQHELKGAHNDPAGKTGLSLLNKLTLQPWPVSSVGQGLILICQGVGVILVRVHTKSNQ